MRWWWVRHAPTAAKGFVGWTDAAADLSDGEAVARLRGTLPDDARVLTSDLRRAVATEAALRRSGWAAPVASPALREQNFGDWDGLDAASVAGADHARLDAFWADMAGARPPGGESFADLIDRVGQVIRAENAAQGGDVVVVAHAGVIRAALAVALDLPPGRALGFDIAPLSLTRTAWHGSEGGWGVDGVNWRP